MGCITDGGDAMPETGLVTNFPAHVESLVSLELPLFFIIRDIPIGDLRLVLVHILALDLAEDAFLSRRLVSRGLVEASSISTGRIGRSNSWGREIGDWVGFVSGHGRHGWRS